ncbi:OmpA family protein [Aquimarina agarilytica]|uniref:OmpA family protein n=1 Tax=Aquimarina agarilytica TaxID=1087449 RepID=UPI000289693A|nr:OmpA family protein [Aquimarina agarilytica]
MKKKYTLTLIVSVLISFWGLAQQKKLEQANKSYERYAYIDTQKILLKVADKGYRSADLFQKLGNSYYFNADYENAVIWYAELIKEGGDLDAEYYFRYAQSLKAMQEYAASDKFMNKFYTLKGGDIRAKNYQEEPEYLRKIDFQSGRYKVKNIVANSVYSDFGPAYYGERLLFASARDTGVFAKRVHEWNNSAFLDLYVGKIKEEESGEVKTARKFSRRLNTKFHESTPVFTNDLKTVYFTRNNYNAGDFKKDKNGTNRLKIYKSKREKKSDWSKAEEISINSDEYTVSHPALSPDNKKLYFSSDMPGGYGHTDLYEVSIADDGTLGEPKNLGPKINTEGREAYPFVSKSGDLYFSSNGHIGLGGLDLYVAKIDSEAKETEIYNLGKPANSPKDDFAFIVNEDTKTGYFSSNRDGGRGDDDIYRFIQLEDIREACEVKLEGVVTDKDTKALLPGAQVTLYDSGNNAIETLRVGEKANYSFTVECDKNYFLRGDKEAYNTTEELVTTPNNSETVEVSLALEKAVKEAKIGQDLGKILNLNPIYFNFDKYNIRNDAALELAKVIAVMEEYPTMKIDVRSHTDSRANDQYNQVLSTNRNKATIDYIVEKGKISRDRITGRGYGESQLVNECANGVPCSVEKHQLNRRSEFIILEY